MTAGAPKGNTNAEKWTFEVAESFMLEAVKLSRQPRFDFIGEVAFELEQDKGVFDYVCDKFPDLNSLKRRLKTNCERNCFHNSKNGNIREATAIVNLKANHGWKDRSDITSDDKQINIPPITWIGEDTPQI
jgi:hypothetical protein